MDSLTPEELEQLKKEKYREIEKAVEALSAHFNHVQILATTEIEPAGNTWSVVLGTGNWHARIGIAKEFVETDSARTFVNEMPKNPPDESDSWKEQ